MGVVCTLSWRLQSLQSIMYLNIMLHTRQIMGVIYVLELNPKAPEAQHHETPPEQLRDGGWQWLADSGERGHIEKKKKCMYLYFLRSNQAKHSCVVMATSLNLLDFACLNLCPRIQYTCLLENLWPVTGFNFLIKSVPVGLMGTDRSFVGLHSFILVFIIINKFNLINIKFIAYRNT